MAPVSALKPENKEFVEVDVDEVDVDDVAHKDWSQSAS